MAAPLPPLAPRGRGVGGEGWTCTGSDKRAPIRLRRFDKFAQGMFVVGADHHHRDPFVAAARRELPLQLVGLPLVKGAPLRRVSSSIQLPEAQFGNWTFLGKAPAL